MKVLAAQALGPRWVRVGLETEVPPQLLVCTFTALEAPAVQVKAIATEVEGATVHVVLDTEMTPDVRYRVRVSDEDQVFYDETAFTGYRPPRPAHRQFELWTMLPRHNRRDDVTGDLQRFIGCAQEVLDQLLHEIDRYSELFDLERAPEPFIDRILQDLGNPFVFELDGLAKRRLGSVLVEMYRQKGTEAGIINAIRFFMGIEVKAILPLTQTTLTLGESYLGENWEVGTSKRFARYAFDVEVDHILTEAQRRQMRTIVDYLKPAHAHFVQLIEPRPPRVLAHWELGLSELGETSTLHENIKD